MSCNNLKTHYSAKELLGLSLSAFPNSVQGIIYQAKNKNGKLKKELVVAAVLNTPFPLSLKRCKRKSEINLRLR